MFRPSLLAAFAVLGSTLMSGTVTLTNRTLNPLTLQRVAQAHEALSATRITLWDDLVIGAGATEHLEVPHPGSYLFELLDVNHASLSTIKIVQPEAGEVRLTPSWDETSGAPAPLHPALRMESIHEVAIVDPAFMATPHLPSPFPFPAPVERPAASTAPVPSPSEPSRPSFPVEPMGRPLSLPPSAAMVDFATASDAELEILDFRFRADGASVPPAASDFEIADTSTSHYISFPFTHTTEGEYGFPAALVVMAGTEVIGRLRCEVHKSGIRTIDRFFQVSFDVSGSVKLHRECEFAPAFPIALRTCASHRPTGYLTPMSGHKGNYVKLQSVKPRSRATTVSGRAKASESKIMYELRIPNRYSGKPITVEYQTIHRSGSNQTGWRLVLGETGGWAPMLGTNDGMPTEPLPPTPTPPPPPPPPPPPTLSSTPPTSTPIPSMPSSVSSSPAIASVLRAESDAPPPPIPTDMPSKPPLVRSLRYICNVPEIKLDAIEDAKVITTKEVLRLFQEDQVLIVDLGNDNQEGFAGHMETMLFIWTRTMDTVRNAGGSAGYSSWREAWYSHVRTMLQPETKRPLPSPHRVRRDDTENMKGGPGLMGYTVVWSVTNNHAIIGKISEANEFEEMAWWTEHLGQPLTLEIAQSLLRRFVSNPQPGRGRWVSFIPVLPELRTRLVNHYFDIAPLEAGEAK